MADPYSVLGVARGADEKAIKTAYRKLAKELHPDRNADNPKAAERFSEITRAYDLLTDPGKRAAYDRGEIDENGEPRMPFGAGGFGGGPRPGAGGTRFDFGGEGIDLGDLFGDIMGGRGGASSGFGGGGFRGRAAPPPRGANVAYRLRVPFIDAATLAPQRITLADGKTIDLKLPAGVETGTQMRLSGKGEAGPGGAGDAIVTIAVDPHPFFRREGDDVLLDLPVTLREAVLGAKVKVPTVDGPVMLTVPPGSSSGKLLRLKGKGFAGKGGARGDQRVRMEIVIPAGDAALAEFAERWTPPGDVRAGLGV